MSNKLASHKQVSGKDTALLPVDVLQVSVYTRPSAHIQLSWCVLKQNCNVFVYLKTDLEEARLGKGLRLLGFNWIFDFILAGATNTLSLYHRSAFLPQLLSSLGTC